ncbi:hypothetical protein CapIbe_021664 [Capra ibex]
MVLDCFFPLESQTYKDRNFILSTATSTQTGIWHIVMRSIHPDREDFGKWRACLLYLLSQHQDPFQPYGIATLPFPFIRREKSILLNVFQTLCKQIH